MNAQTPRCCRHCSLVFLNFAATMRSLSIVYPHLSVDNEEATMLLWRFYFACNNESYFALRAEIRYFCPFLPKFWFSRQFHKSLQYQMSSKPVQWMDWQTEMAKPIGGFCEYTKAPKNRNILNFNFIRSLFYKQNLPFCDQAIPLFYPNSLF
jgi:hypothetical protein